ncbi:MAG: hypothetical protein RR295_08150, partial [Oscillospiraceae bacterium]
MSIDNTASYQQLCSCTPDSCGKVGVQCVNVSVPVEVTPRATVGAISVACQGTPTVSCETSGSHGVCVITITQKVCMTIPVRYGVTTNVGDETIACDPL